MKFFDYIITVFASSFIMVMPIMFIFGASLDLIEMLPRPLEIGVVILLLCLLGYSSFLAFGVAKLAVYEDKKYWASFREAHNNNVMKAKIYLSLIFNNK